MLSPAALASPVFLVVDDIEDNRQLVCRVLLRRFPKSTILECMDFDEAAGLIKKTVITACVVHRSADTPCLPLLSKIRSLTNRPILSICGTCKEKAARQSGADAFVDFDAWLRVGSSMEDLLARDEPPRAGG
jgi:hypothetical protein